MRRFAIAFLVCGIAFSYAIPANAGALGLLHGGLNTLEDDDYELFIDVDGDGTIAEGDFIIGMITMQAVNGSDTSGFGATFEGILVSQITGISGTTLTLGAVSASDYSDLQDGTIASFSNLPTRMSTDSAVLVFDDQTEAGNTPPFVNPDGTGSGDAGANDALLSAQEGTELFEFGFGNSVSSDAVAADTYSEATVNTLTLANINSLDFLVGLNVTYNGTSLGFIPVLNPADLTRPETDISGAGNEDLFNPKGDFDIKTDGDYLINVVPEPASLTLILLGSITLCGVGYSRTRKSTIAA